jgi:hypothetical protein
MTYVDCGARHRMVELRVEHGASALEFNEAKPAREKACRTPARDRNMLVFC